MIFLLILINICINNYEINSSSAAWFLPLLFGRLILFYLFWCNFDFFVNFFRLFSEVGHSRISPYFEFFHILLETLVGDLFESNINVGIIFG